MGSTLTLIELYSSIGRMLNKVEAPFSIVRCIANFDFRVPVAVYIKPRMASGVLYGNKWLFGFQCLIHAIYHTYVR